MCDDCMGMRKGRIYVRDIARAHLNSDNIFFLSFFFTFSLSADNSISSEYS